MPRVLVVQPDGWLLEGAAAEWPRPPDPHPEVSLVAWARTGPQAVWSGYASWTDVDSWQARSRSGRLTHRVRYTRWVPARLLRPVPGEAYGAVPRLRLHGPPESWPRPAVGPDGLPWFGEHRVYPPVTASDPPR